MKNIIRIIGLSLLFAISTMAVTAQDTDIDINPDSAFVGIDRVGAHSMFLRAIDIAGLDEEFSASDEITIFVPSDVQFNIRLNQLNVSYEALLEDEATLRSLLLYHIQDGLNGPHNVSNRDMIITQNGQSVMLVISSGNQYYFLEDSTGRRATILALNPTPTSAYVYPIIGLLIPSVDLPVTQLPESVTIEFENLLPEGLEWDATRKQFLVSSQMFGTIHAVSDDGTLTPLIEDDDLGFTNGIHIDTARNRLLVTTNGAEAILDCEVVREEHPFAGLAVYDLETLKRTALYDLSSLYPSFGSFINDVTVDAYGNIYATDWCGGGVFKIDTEGNTSTLFTGESFYVAAPMGHGALNGIDWHPDNYLLVSGGFGTGMYKVTLDIPISITPVVLNAGIFADGITILPNGDAVAVGVIVSEESEVGFFPATMRFTSEDDWQTASLNGSMIYPRFATTGVVRDGEFYSVLSGVIEPLPVTTYEILRIDFDGMDQ